LLLEIMEDENQIPRVRIAAAKILLDLAGYKK
jgi:hypothetical protein